MKRGVVNPNPKGIMLQDLSRRIQEWRNKSKHREVIIMMDANKDIQEEGGFSNCVQDNDMVDIAT